MQVIYILDNENNLKEELQKKFINEKKVKFKKIKISNLEEELRNIPSLIIINEDTLEQSAVEICKKLEINEDNAITPIIVVSSEHNKKHKIDILKAKATYFIKSPVDIDMLYYTIVNIMRLLFINRKVSPLTSLPGNVQIQAEIKKRLANKEYFVMLYFDLDNFKAYNDVYGFSNGDEIIKYTARIITNKVHKEEEDNNFVGHIGGDDFIAIVDSKEYEKICQDVIAEFDSGIIKFFDSKDIERGYLEIENRKGMIEQFPITSISIGAVEVQPGSYASPLEIGEVGAQVKHLSKTIPGSTYVINRRRKNSR